MRHTKLALMSTELRTEIAKFMNKYKFGVVLALLLAVRLAGQIINIFSNQPSGSQAMVSIIVAILYLAALLGVIGHKKSGIIIALILVLLNLVGGIFNLSSLSGIEIFNFLLDVLMLVFIYFSNKEIKTNSQS